MCDKPTTRDELLYFLCGTNANRTLRGSWHVTCCMMHGIKTHSKDDNFLDGWEPWKIWGTSTQSGCEFLGLGCQPHIEEQILNPIEKTILDS